MKTYFIESLEIQLKMEFEYILWVGAITLLFPPLATPVHL